MAFKKKQREEQQKLKELQAKAAKGGPLGTMWRLIRSEWWNQEEWQEIEVIHPKYYNSVSTLL